MTCMRPPPDPRADLAGFTDVLGALAALLAAADEGVVFLDGEGQIRAASVRAQEILGLSSDELLGLTPADPSWFTVRRDGSPFEAADHPSMVVLRTGESVRGVPMGVQRPDGSLRWIAINAEPVRAPDGAVTGVVTIFRDETDRLDTEGHVRELLDRLAAQALTDPLTELPNRRGFDSRMAEETARARRHRTPLSLAVIDVDGFKTLNDTRGHPAGDLALVRVAAVLRTSVREEDFSVRLAGDEFAVILPGTGLDAAFAIVERVRAGAAVDDALAKFGLTLSAGVAELGEAGTTADLYRRADAALYAAKAAGGNRTEGDR